MSFPDDQKKLIVQPLDQIMIDLKISNADLVACSTKQLTFKQLQKARKGKKVTPNIQNKILQAIHTHLQQEVYTLKQLFNY